PMATRCSWPRPVRSLPTPFFTKKWAMTRRVGFRSPCWQRVLTCSCCARNFEASTVAELIARAKASPGKITSATPGAGSVGHLATVQLEMLAGITTAQIPYRGLSHALNDLIAGHVDMMFDTPTTSLALHRDGKVKIVAVGTTERVRDLPEVPT